MKVTLNINPGDCWCIVHDWHQTADLIRAQCLKIGAFKDSEAGRLWLVQWEGMGEPPFETNRIGEIFVLTDSSLNWWCNLIHETLREKAN